jgi:DNA helicase-2/ATP-dependent DNA helicase PcrA
MEKINIIYELPDNEIDDHVDAEIKQCFSKDIPKSFFLFAGAGSGKTRSLINTLSFIDTEYGKVLSTYSKQIAVITYTNAACDEISKRLQYKPIFAVSTIHSFLWELIKNYQVDIKYWITESINNEISIIVQKQSSGRSGNATSKREEDIKKKTDRLNHCKKIYI